MSTELERRLMDAFHDDAQRARLVNPDHPGPTVSHGDGQDVPHLQHQGRRLMLVAAATIAVVGLGMLAVTAVQDPDRVQTDTVPPTPAPSTTPAPTAPSATVEPSPTTLPATTTVPAAPVVPVAPDTTTPQEPSPALSGTWVASDVVYNAREMDLAVSEAGSAQLSVHENSPTCVGGATMTWTGAHGSAGELVFTTYAETCGEESEPIRSGKGGTYTLAYDNESDTLTDNLGVVWWRKGADKPSQGGMWPQATPEEVQEAQELADAGDPAYTWQIDPELASLEPHTALSPPHGPEIVERFLREKLGWEEFLINQYAADSGSGGKSDGEYWIPLQYLRCAPGETNPIYPVQQQFEPYQLCAPTLDEYHYETVRLDLSQFGGPRPDGIWVVSRWSTTTAPPFEQTDPNVSEAAATAQLEEFLRARLSGEGAEGFIEVVGDLGGEIPLLYATTSGSPYERYELERVRGPEWPHGDTRFMVRLFADGGATVVEQQIDWRRDWRTDLPGCCEHLLAYERNKTTENGEPPIVP